LVGGRSQSSDYTIDCRFNNDVLAERILKVKRLHDDGRIAGVLSSGWRQSMHRARGYAALNDNSAATVVYLDPPYINKADQIYTLQFTDRDHREIAANLKGSPHRWVMSYDAEPLILDLYRS
jgi:DNA adenine methylase